jgi:hypothetical protein
VTEQVQYWSRSMEKKLGDRVQTVLCDPYLLTVFQEFGGETFRRSSVFHGLEKFLADNMVRGKLCFEIGTWNGLTAAVLSRHFDQVVTVDIAHNELKHTIIKRLGIQNIQFVDIGDNYDKWKVAEELDFDFAFLDGNHADDTAADWEIVKRCGRVLFHEAWPFQIPVWKLVQGLPQEQVIYGGDGLALWKRPEGVQ